MPKMTSASRASLQQRQGEGRNLLADPSILIPFPHRLHRPDGNDRKERHKEIRHLHLKPQIPASWPAHERRDEGPDPLIDQCIARVVRAECDVTIEEPTRLRDCLNVVGDTTLDGRQPYQISGDSRERDECSRREQRRE